MIFFTTKQETIVLGKWATFVLMIPFVLPPFGVGRRKGLKPRLEKLKYRLECRFRISDKATFSLQKNQHLYFT